MAAAATENHAGVGRMEAHALMPARFSARRAYFTTKDIESSSTAGCARVWVSVHALGRTCAGACAGKSRFQRWQQAPLKSMTFRI